MLWCQLLRKEQKRFMVSDSLLVEVVYALPLNETILNVKCISGMTIEEIIRESGVLARHPEIDLTSTKVGIYSKMVPLSTVVSKNCRIEIYRPLIADPKEIRRQRAEKAKLQAMK